MINKLVRHGSEAGYRAEVERGAVCPRCRNGHLVFGRQYSKKGKAAGLKYRRDEVIDHLYAAGKGYTGNYANSYQNFGGARGIQEQFGDYSVTVQEKSASVPADVPETPSQPSVADRLTDALAGRLRGSTGGSEPSDSPYVADGDTDGLTPAEPDPEPSGSDWSAVTDEEFIINAAGVKKIEDSLGTYLSVIGLTVEMIDPYCGPILAQNLTIMVERWAKVIAQYPSAAKIFLDGKGGILMLWISALQATWPVLYAIYEHHLGKTIRVHDGVIERKVPNNSAFRGFDATTPPMQDNFQYSVD